jgi:heptose-I-phosphate ethanolaminephosphotransferase
MAFRLSVCKRSLSRFAVVFLFTYLSVYLFSVTLGLNTSLFDFLKGVAFSLVACSTCIMVRALCLEIETGFLKRIFSFISYVVLFVFVLLPSVLICYFVATGSLISSDIIIALAQTNATEGTEFIQSNFNIMWLLAFLTLAVIYAVNAYFFRAVESFDSSRFVTALSFFLCLASSVWLALPRMDYLPLSIIKVTSKQLDNFEIYKQQKSRRLAKLNNLTSLKLSDTTDPEGNLFVLVIGESETRDRMQAYGFERENTPYLCEQLKKPNHILFTNAYSSWPQTVQALSYSLTEANQYQKKQTVDAYSIIELARATGFETFWISNQRKYGVYETPVTVISSTANHEIWVNGSSKMEGVFFDEEIVRRFPKIDEKKNVFVVIHLMGSHQKYDKRLPSEFIKFEGQDETLDYYDDTVLYTDYILEKIYSKAKEKSNFKAMIYFSDHGEDPHVVGGHDPVNLNGQMLRIPLTVYLSDKYVQDNPVIHDALVANRDKYFSNDLIFDLTVRIMGISGLPEMEDRLNLADKSYALDKKSVLTMYGKMHLDEIPETRH